MMLPVRVNAPIICAQTVGSAASKTGGTTAAPAKEAAGRSLSLPWRCGSTLPEGQKWVHRRLTFPNSQGHYLALRIEFGNAITRGQMDSGSSSMSFSSCLMRRCVAW